MAKYIDLTGLSRFLDKLKSSVIAFKLKKNGAAEMDGCSATGSHSVAEGFGTSASGERSHAEGYNTTASGERSHAEGMGSHARTNFTVDGAANARTYTTNQAHYLRVGQVIEYDDTYSRIESVPSPTSFTVDHTLSSTALDAATITIITGIAYGTSSHAEGANITAGGAASHAEGINTWASGDYSHAEGTNTRANGSFSHAEGDHTTANGNASHTEGYHTVANNNVEHAEGQFNVSHSATTTYGSSGNTQHSVGIGNSSQSKNAFEIMQNGDIYVVGLGGYDGTNAGATGIQTLQQLLSSLNN